MHLLHRVFLWSLLLGASIAIAQQAGHRKPTLPVVSLSFDPTGRLWRAEVRDGFVLVASSRDQGRTFGPEVPVNREPQRIWNDGENRPKVLADGRGAVHVSYTQMLSERMAGHVRYARSTDFGRTFSDPLVVNDDLSPISHRFDAMVIDANGQVWIAWLDKRDQTAAQAAGVPYGGAALYYARGFDGRFEPNVKVADHTCECCRIAVALDSGAPVAFWRHVFDGNVRDHAKPQRVSHDGWRLDGCPHHGGAMAASDGIRHYAWFTGSEDRAGIGYANSAGTRTRHFGDSARQPGRPTLLAQGRRVYLAWKEFDGHRTQVMLARSSNGGMRWTKPTAIAEALTASDHPFLLSHGDVAYLAWSVEGRPLKLQPLDEVAS